MSKFFLGKTIYVKLKESGWRYCGPCIEEGQEYLVMKDNKDGCVRSFSKSELSIIEVRGMQ